MKLSKAIELLTIYLSEGYKMTPDDLHGAMALGNEALKHYQIFKRNELIDPSYSLPGETPENEK